jgi:hypothetical protein
MPAFPSRLFFDEDEDGETIHCAREEDDTMMMMLLLLLLAAGQL